jgi:hypothetical protein
VRRHSHQRATVDTQKKAWIVFRPLMLRVRTVFRKIAFCSGRTPVSPPLSSCSGNSRIWGILVFCSMGISSSAWWLSESLLMTSDIVTISQSMRIYFVVRVISQPLKYFFHIKLRRVKCLVFHSPPKVRPLDQSQQILDALSAVSTTIQPRKLST